ncbi:DUF6478 family protein [Sulfitobacter sp. D35]|uniref:DUF6478 family protein n=1 Tax=Sulfitobacter sp. D35 TaxID=3083252 RepID=UPI00296F7DFD|nr:DUF6478 family protein [Sulfitobacter sp. D35]MDW4498288.1 DUF6478 family protein [Sulfitobacter sp. D35]
MAMADGGDSILDLALYRREMRHWTRAARRATSTRPAVLQRQRDRARLLRGQLDRLICAADDRLSGVGDAPPSRPHNADWVWTPAAWQTGFERRGRAPATSGTGFGENLTLFHDCPRSEIVLRQIPSAAAGAKAVSLDVYAFEGSFLSLAIDLPEEATRGLRRTHLFRLGCRVASESPLTVYARLNLRHGPNTAQILRELPDATEPVAIEFDLAYTDFDETRDAKAWIDLIFEHPEMNQISVHDLSLSRRPRAQV